MNKKIKSTSDDYIESLNPQRLKEFKEGYREFALAELILALMKEDEISVHKLAKIADVSLTVLQAIRFKLKNNKQHTY